MILHFYIYTLLFLHVLGMGVFLRANLYSNFYFAALMLPVFGRALGLF